MVLFAIYDSTSQNSTSDDWVLDKETGLVWLRNPYNYYWSPMTWDDAVGSCVLSILGGRQGWRLPTIEELSSLKDFTVSGSLKLPAGHPFLNIQNARYWSSTTDASYQTRAWVSDMTGQEFTLLKSSSYYLWPVRGGNGCQ
jgi:hypothetical protein